MDFIEFEDLKFSRKIINDKIQGFKQKEIYDLAFNVEKFNFLLSVTLYFSRKFQILKLKKNH